MEIGSTAVFDHLKKTANDIRNLLAKTGQYGEIDALILYGDSADERQRQNEIYKMLNKLEDVADKIEYLSRPIRLEGNLHKNDRGRYELKGYEFTCGCPIEILLPDNENCFVWVATRIEFSDALQDYAPYGFSSLKLDGTRARLR